MNKIQDTCRVCKVTSSPVTLCTQVELIWSTLTTLQHCMQSMMTRASSVRHCSWWVIIRSIPVLQWGKNQMPNNTTHLSWTPQSIGSVLACYHLDFQPCWIVVFSPTPIMTRVSNKNMFLVLSYLLHHSTEWSDMQLLCKAIGNWLRMY